MLLSFTVIDLIFEIPDQKYWQNEPYETDWFRFMWVNNDIMTIITILEGFVYLIFLTRNLPVGGCGVWLLFMFYEATGLIIAVNQQELRTLFCDLVYVFFKCIIIIVFTRAKKTSDVNIAVVFTLMRQSLSKEMCLRQLQNQTVHRGEEVMTVGSQQLNIN